MIEELLHEQLGKREFEVMVRIAIGNSNRQIAEQLNIKPKTVSEYKSRLIKKMRMKSANELIRYTVKNNLVE